MPAPLFKYRQGYGRDLSDQAFLFKVESKEGKILDWRDYLDVSTPGYGGCGPNIDGGAVLRTDSEGRLEFTARASRKIGKGLKMGVYPSRGKMLNLAQRSYGAGVPGEIFVYKSTYDDGDDMRNIDLDFYPRPRYWQKKEGKQIMRGSEVCISIAHELRPDEWYSERGLLEYYLVLEWDHGE